MASSRFLLKIVSREKHDCLGVLLQPVWLVILNTLFGHSSERCFSFTWSLPTVDPISTRLVLTILSKARLYETLQHKIVVNQGLCYLNTLSSKMFSLLATLALPILFSGSSASPLFPSTEFSTYSGGLLARATGCPIGPASCQNTTAQPDSCCFEHPGVSGLEEHPYRTLLYPPFLGPISSNSSQSLPLILRSFLRLSLLVLGLVAIKGTCGQLGKQVITTREILLALLIRSPS